ncbi:hypothetical protein [Mesorhizobium retamae]|uniref:Tail fiber protein n=1 Tax=Mesorhizobium retamae TaxID=2912854 RepID=A0ABS9QIJ1_9HYPH|nr:hypothetical protein [Mesorhizobium sp. IRAMC:0171]MCG7507220.1 hypothetical protein [Mesorhizobium sp. IRAMC:0171]
MPRVNGVYQLLPGVYGVPNEPIASAPYNSQLDDLAKDANDPRPVTAGGTGGQTAGAALSNLGFSAFVKSIVDKATDVLFRAAIGADDATNLTKGTLPAGRISDASHGQLSGGNLHAGATAAANGFMSAADKAKLDGLVDKQLTGWVSGRDYTNGYLVVTSIPATASDGAPFLIEVVGNSYGALTPFDIKVQGYLYGNAIINHGALSSGTKPTEIWLFQHGGFLCCWIPWQQYWQGFTVFASDVGYPAADKPAKNLVTSIQNLGKPAGRTKEVSVPIVQAALSNLASFNTSAIFQGAPQQFIISRSDGQQYIHWQNAAGNVERGYIGYASGTTTTMILNASSGEMQLWAAGARQFRLTANYIIAERAMEITSSIARAVNASTSAADYAIVGRSTNAGYGGVLGYAADTGIYGILGYANAYSFYGSGKLYTTGNIQSASSIFSDGGSFYGGSIYTILGGQAAGWIYLRPQTPQSSAGEFKVSPAGDAYAYNRLYTGNGAAYLDTGGNPYGPTWGGYLSSWIYANLNVIYKGANASETSLPIGHILGCADMGGLVNNGIAPRLADGSKYQTGGSGAYLAGDWRSRGTISGAHGILQRVA